MPPKRPKLVCSLSGLPRIGRYVTTAHNVWLRSKFYRTYDAKSVAARRAFEAAEPVSLTDVQQRVLSGLIERGLAHVSFSELFNDQHLWENLSACVNQWLSSSKIKDKERDYRDKDYLEGNWKEYILRLYEQEPTLSFDDPWLNLGLQPQLLDIVNSYLRMMSKLIYVDVWNTIPVASKKRPLTGSLRWHRDPEDIKLVKVFLYFTDVDSTSGPLHYIPQSRKGDKYGHLWPHEIPKGSVPPSDALESAIPSSEWEVCAYPSGTLIFADTTGFHMGGRATARNRVFATWNYVTPGSLWPKVFKLDQATMPQSLSAAALFALS